MRIKTLSSILAIAFVLAGCTREDLADCPDDISAINIKLRYDQEDTSLSDLPIQRANLYLFDAEQRFVYALTDSIGPFISTRAYPIPLEPGHYTAVAWANQDSTYHVTPSPFVAGRTTLGDARLQLAALTSTSRAETELAITGPAQPLYHAIEKQIIVLPRQTTEAVLPLRRNTKEINLLVRFKHRDGSSCIHPKFKNTPAIRSNDGILDFENSRLACDTIRYQPSAKADTVGGYDARFHKMRLFLDGKSQIVLTGNDKSLLYTESLMKLIKGTGYNTQEKIDNTHIYNVELRFTCDEDSTHVTVSIYVNGWKYVETTDDL